MSDPLRTDPPLDAAEASGGERDAKIEELLLDGLDHYFSGRYEQAIHIWTRVLFLDRGHARARAYIERARSALSERQRESEELLYRGVHAFNRGDTEVARDLLTDAIDRGGPNEVALALLARLSRLSTTNATELSAPPARPAERWKDVSVALQHPPRRRISRVLLGAVILLVAGVIGTLFVGPDEMALRVGLSGALPPPTALAAAAPPGALPVPRGSEGMLERAKVLATAGHLNEALAALERVRLGDPLRPDADRLRAEVQKQLLSLAQIDIAQPSTSTSAASRPPE
jgi:tetratricopeptide (TPR) repeat protein